MYSHNGCIWDFQVYCLHNVDKLFCLVGTINVSGKGNGHALTNLHAREQQRYNINKFLLETFSSQACDVNRCQKEGGEKKFIIYPNKQCQNNILTLSIVNSQPHQKEGVNEDVHDPLTVCGTVNTFQALTGLNAIFTCKQKLKAIV